MKTLISTHKFISNFPSLSHKFNTNIIYNHTFLNLQTTKPLLTSYPCSCSCSSDHNGWADLITTTNSTESTQLNKLLTSLGLTEKKYAFVYLFGFICALGFSRVRVSSIVVFPACFLVFGVGFSLGVVNRLDINEGVGLFSGGKRSKKKKVKDDEFRVKDGEIRVLVDGLKSLVDLFDGFGVKVGTLKESMRKDVGCNRVSRSDLVGYIESVEAIERDVVQAKSVIEGCMVVDANDAFKFSSDQIKKVERKGFDFSRLVAGFRERSFGSKGSKVKDSVKNEKQTKVMDPLVEEKTVKSVIDEDKSVYDDGDVRVKETYGGKTIGRMGRMTLMEMEDDAKQVFETDEYAVKDNKARFYEQRRRKGYYEREQQDHDLYNGNNMLYDDVESNEHEGYGNKDRFDASPSSEISSDVLFNDYLTEADGLLKQAREWLTHRGIEEDTEQMLYKSTELLSKAVDMKPMSLLAVGQLGNTYLLHGELKLKLSRKLRALLADSDSNVVGRLDDEVSNREKFVDYLVNVCEECEELLVKAGRKYRLALSIDGDDMRALYNWGLALSFRAQLIADIGPEAAFDADKVYLAAIDKFNAMMSRSNAHTPDALFRWGVALQQRSRLRTRNFREKVKLLSQAKRLYEDALLMDSNNMQVKQALMTCESELRYKNRF